ncbi:hypothetical protein [Paludibacterium paludis]|uniref:Uncharacterized protein n=1 Tax=Paludibacterium paludis TaxID=1225769 RepID=A0A918U7L6_9NEIS|nr:hypothetical protein [Paludibacterium paludis]GGY05072.1 hypothetical protein GCM10011289_04540 [Paludibacterium paludis]
MSNFKLSLPTDIPWERICVTEDMMDRNICDERLPAKWQTSMAVFKYRPDDANQLYPNYTITYLKVTATITGYQPLDKEVQGQINWNGLNVATIPGLTDLLNAYNPCHGAILQVLVGPSGHNEKIPLSDYPFFLDFEPKKRELYELATDTKEKQSRSIESVNVTKSAGNTQSTEIFDIDMGGGGGGGQVSVFGTGGGFNYNAPHGQWGTKRMNAEEGMATRSTDTGEEKRETYSFTSQISQMYHQLDSYHLGTNRAVFFIQPRPHTLEEPSGFVRGPRPVEGIQEFFLVVAQPKQQKDFCVAVRLDTSHLTRTPVMDFDRKSVSTSIATANAPVATDHDIPAENIVGARACFIDCWDVHYQCYRTEAHDTVTFDAPAGYRIEGFNDLINEATHGSTSVVVTPNGATLNINVQANGHICYEGSEVCVNCPDTIQAWAGHARRQVQVNLVSTTPTKKVGEQEVLMITTRGLCCCANERVRHPTFTNEYVTAIKAVPPSLAPIRPVTASDTATHLPSLVTGAPAGALQETPRTASHTSGLCPECAGAAHTLNTATAAATPPAPAGYTLRQANELGGYIRTETLKSLNDPFAIPKKFVDTDFFAKQLEYAVVQTKKGRQLVDRPASEQLPKRAVDYLAKRLRKPPKEVTLSDALALQGRELAEVSGLSEAAIQRLKLTALGVAFHEDKPGKGAKPKPSAY